MWAGVGHRETESQKELVIHSWRNPVKKGRRRTARGGLDPTVSQGQRIHYSGFSLSTLTTGALWEDDKSERDKMWELCSEAKFHLSCLFQWLNEVREKSEQFHTPTSLPEESKGWPTLP